MRLPWQRKLDVPSGQAIGEKWLQERLADKPEAPAYQINKGNLEAVAYTGWTYACVRRIVEKACACPWVIEKGKKAVDGTPVGKLLEQANPLQSNTRMLQTTMLSLELWGTAYWVTERTTAGKAAELWPIPGNRMRISDTANGLPTQFAFMRSDGKELYYPAEDVVFFRYEAPGVAGSSMAPITAAIQQIQVDLNAIRYYMDYFNRGTAPQMAIIREDDMPADERRELRVELEQLYRGLRNFFKPLLLTGNAKLQELSAQPSMAWLKLREQLREEILAVWGVYPALVGVFANAQYGVSIAEQKSMFWEDTLMPRLETMADDINKQLVWRMDPNATFRWSYEQVDALRKSYVEAARVAVNLVAGGIADVNEVRLRFLDMEARTEPEASALRQQSAPQGGLQ